MVETENWWLIGASEGLGRAIAHELDRQGVTLWLSARNSERLETLCAKLQHAKALPLDVTDLTSVEAAAKHLPDLAGVIYCAGVYEPMAATAWDTKAAIHMTQVNYIGALNIMGVAVPKMLARAKGRIVLIGSLAGHRGLPGAIGYGASKAALMHLAENLRADLRRTGILVQVINPGFVDTRLSRKNDFKMPFLLTPDKAAQKIGKIIKGRRFSTSFPAPFSWLFQMGRYMPIWLFHSLFRR